MVLLAPPCAHKAGISQTGHVLTKLTAARSKHESHGSQIVCEQACPACLHIGCCLLAGDHILAASSATRAFLHQGSTGQENTVPTIAPVALYQLVPDNLWARLGYQASLDPPGCDDAAPPLSDRDAAQFLHRKGRTQDAAGQVPSETAVAPVAGVSGAELATHHEPPLAVLEQEQGCSGHGTLCTAGGRQRLHTYQQVTLGTLDAPVGTVAVVFMSVVSACLHL